MRTFAILILLLPAVLFAQPTETEEELLEDVSTTIVKNIDAYELASAVAERSAPGVWYLLTQSLKGQAPTSEQYGAAISRVRSSMRTRIGNPETLHQTVAAALDETFTPQELKTLQTFLGTSAGRKALPVLVELDRLVWEAVSEEGQAEITRIVDETTGGSRSHDAAVKRTMSDIRSIYTATEGYAADQDRYPNVLDYSGLAQAVSPRYIRRVPQTDGWGEPFVYVMSGDGTRYRFISGGADKKIDFASRTLGIDGGDPILTTDPAADIIFENGAFVQLPQWIVEEMNREE